MEDYRLTHLDALEAESIHILREVLAEFARPVVLYSVGKDSSVLLRLVQKACAPGPIPLPLLHIDTSYKFEEMYAFRDRVVEEVGARLIVETNRAALDEGAGPTRLGTQRCCALLKTQALLAGLAAGGFDAAIGGARRDEEKSRAKERVYSFRDARGQWDPKGQRPEIWSLFNGRIQQGESIRVFPLSNWTESDVWAYIDREDIPVVPLYFAKEREVVVSGDMLIPCEIATDEQRSAGRIERIVCRFRTLGCSPCTGAVRSEATTVREIMDEMLVVRESERANRTIDHDAEGSMEQKKQEGYF